MNHTYVLSDELRPELKSPLGRISEGIDDIKSIEIIVTVGDKSSDYILSNGIHPKICIYDNKIKRKEIETYVSIKSMDARQVYVKNPAGGLTQEACNAVKDAFGYAQATKIEVDGEEDLMTLVAIRFAPHESLVIYGQPDAGMVIVVVDAIIKEKVENILKRMEDEV